MPSYATKSEFRAVAFQATVDALPDATLDAILERASRWFDRLAGVSDNTFAPATGLPAERVFYPDGTDYLQLDPFQEGTITGVTMPSGYTVPDYSEVGSNLLARTYNDNGSLSSVLSDFAYGFDSWAYSGYGWPAGVPVTVLAEWGTGAAQAAEATQATIWLAIYIWRSDPAFMNAVAINAADLNALYTQASALAAQNAPAAAGAGVLAFA